ncbi:MAG: DUF4153 domain-containing protein [Chitinophagales bacterium]|nr:DUF4153 domain-containing protein [Chitinophagaceae bacterium]MCB9065232.1 DUF4153 domain-containing protein [Chitinophagales bacterium]
MKLPSFKTITDSAFSTLKRFPLPLLFAVVGTALCIHMIELNDNTLENWMIRSLFTCFIGLPCMLGCALFAERATGNMQKVAITVLGLALVTAYWLWFAPGMFFEDAKLGIVFFVLNICMHLWVAVAAYVGRTERAGFWRFNEELFIRIILSVIFSGVLYAGLSIAILSMDELFKLKIDSLIYAKLFFVVAGVFNTWFFLAGVPKDYESINEEATFPKWLKIFTQYILIPLTILYLLILYAYALKILIQWSLPKGWVSMLVMCYSLVGVLATLLVYPLRESTENAWVKLFAKFFFIAIMPLIILLFVAVGARIGDYGITEPRYYLLMLGSWLAFIALYYTFSKQKSIKLIPVSLLVLGLLSLVGPWSVFSISSNSQMSRLERILIKYEMIDEGVGVKAPKSKMTVEDADELKNVVSYMLNNGYVEPFNDLLHQDIAALAKEYNKKYDSRWNAKTKVEDSILALLHIDIKESGSKFNYYTFSTVHEVFDVGGYSKVYSLDEIYYGRKKAYEFSLGDSVMLEMKYDSDVKVFEFIDEEDNTVATVNIGELLDRLIEKGDAEKLPADYMAVNSEGSLKLKMVIHKMSVDVRNNDATSINNMDADLLFE